MKVIALAAAMVLETGLFAAVVLVDQLVWRLVAAGLACLLYVVLAGALRRVRSF